MQKTDWALVNEAIRRIASAQRVLIFGSDTVLSAFHTFQLDLMSCGIPAFLYHDEEAQRLGAASLSAGDVALFAATAEHAIVSEQYEILQTLKQRDGITSIVMCQEASPELTGLADIFITFGVLGQSASGLYSLLLLSTCMSQMIHEV